MEEKSFHDSQTVAYLFQVARCFPYTSKRDKSKLIPLSKMSVPKHPLDPITAAGIVQVSTLLKAHSPNEKLHFKIITIIEPPKYQLR
jgi:Cu2+-containing amine oxidase